MQGKPSPSHPQELLRWPGRVLGKDEGKRKEEAEPQLLREPNEALQSLSSQRLSGFHRMPTYTQDPLELPRRVTCRRRRSSRASRTWRTCNEGALLAQRPGPWMPANTSTSKLPNSMEKDCVLRLITCEECFYRKPKPLKKDGSCAGPGVAKMEAVKPRVV